MEAKALEIWRQFAAQSELWLGWEHSKVPIGFFDSERAVLFGHPEPPPEFAARTSKGELYYVASPKPPSFIANTSIILNGVHTATIMWPQGEIRGEELVPLVSHEAFHAYQREHNCPAEDIRLTMHYPVNDPLVNAWAEAEAKLLYKVLNNNGGEELVRAALNARASRQALLEPRMATYEDHAELNEGLATYIQVKSAGTGSLVWNQKVDDLEKLNCNGWGADRWRFYYSGMAWALLCDKYVPGWQGQGWQVMARLVAKALGHLPEVQPPTLPGLDMAEIMARHKKEALIRQQEVDSILARVFPKESIRVELKTESPPIDGAWNPITSKTLPGIGRLHTTGLMYRYQSGTVFETKCDCLEKLVCKHLALASPDIEVELDGKPFNKGEGEGSVVVSGPNCTISVPRCRIQYDNAVLLLEEIG